jgi:hypothetical protein
VVLSIYERIHTPRDGSKAKKMPLDRNPKAVRYIKLLLAAQNASFLMHNLSKKDCLIIKQGSPILSLTKIGS